MDFNEYSIAACRTMNGDEDKRHRLANWSLGLAGEAGEAADYLKKHLYHGHELDRDKLAKELGDVLWYLNAIAVECGLNLETEIAMANVHKLADRYPCPTCDGAGWVAQQERASAPCFDCDETGIRFSTERSINR